MTTRYSTRCKVRKYPWPETDGKEPVDLTKEEMEEEEKRLKKLQSTDVDKIMAERPRHNEPQWLTEEDIQTDFAQFGLDPGSAPASKPLKWDKTGTRLRNWKENELPSRKTESMINMQAIWGHFGPGDRNGEDPAYRKEVPKPLQKALDDINLGRINLETFSKAALIVEAADAPHLLLPVGHQPAPSIQEKPDSTASTQASVPQAQDGTKKIPRAPKAKLPNASPQHIATAEGDLTKEEIEWIQTHCSYAEYQESHRARWWHKVADKFNLFFDGRQIARDWSVLRTLIQALGPWDSDGGEAGPSRGRKRKNASDNEDAPRATKKTKTSLGKEKATATDTEN